MALSDQFMTWKNQRTRAVELIIKACIKNTNDIQLSLTKHHLATYTNQEIIRGIERLKKIGVLNVSKC